ncbi:D-arabinono-1 [Perilla frutescens var. hirtella]|uniref:L-gulonolactone oxidase n=1 Tax=Perilla frutescens var. hirtella TaxID=608512 RepID=A0AAD4PDE4_PERFH|nr:D-arabinono-1 [Perilla frutescens var. hirtella]
MAMPPQNPVQCNQTGCTLSNSYGVWGDRKTCHITAVVYPTTEEELRSAVANASKKKQKVKVISKFSHTIPKLGCPTSRSGISTILISTERYNSSIVVDKANMAVTADAGVGLRAVIDRVEEEGLSLVAAPYWEGVSVGGAISTGAHGSSWWGNGGALHDHVIGIRIVVAGKESEGFAKVVDLRESDALFHAARVSLGLLGVISKVTFSLEPGFKRSITLNFTSDVGIEDEFMEHAKKYEFGDIQWYPSSHTAVYRYDHRLPLNTSGHGLNDFIGFQSNFALIAKSVRASEEAAEKARDANGKCVLASSFVAYKKLTANGLKNNNLIFTGYPVVGNQGKMQTSGSCLYSSESNKGVSCAWDPRIKGLFFFETTAIFSATKFVEFTRDVKKLREVVKAENFCGVDIYNGFLVRFIKKSDAYLGQSEDSVVVDFNYYRAGEGLRPRLHQDVWEEVEQMAFIKYSANPHWAKNRKVAFHGVERKYPRFGKFVEARKAVDPDGIFWSESSDEILFGIEGVKQDGCALEGLCICSQDAHCSPGDGYFCQRGLVYDQARVCRYSSTSTS